MLLALANNESEVLKSFITQQTPVQTKKSNSFCLTFIIYMTKQYEYKKYFKIFCKNNLKLNDIIVVEMLLKMIKQ